MFSTCQARASLSVGASVNNTLFLVHKTVATHRMPRHDLREDRRVAHAQPSYAVHAQLRIDDAARGARRHTRRARRVVQRLHARTHKVRESRVALRIERAVEHRARVGEVEPRGERRLLADPQDQADAAHEARDVLRRAEVAVYGAVSC